MFINKVKRATISAFYDITRNIWLNAATVIIIIIALFIMTMIFAIDVVGRHTLSELERKVDISVQFKDDAAESRILEFKSDVEDLAEVESVEYISKEQSIINFKKAHKDDKYINQSIEELGENPLFAVLNIKANNLDDYNLIDKYISNNENYANIIEKVNFKENEAAINSFSNLLRTVKKGAFGLALLFVFISILVAFNAIRLAIYAHRKEIEIMRLVGADNWYIRMQFVIEGAIFGILGGVIAFAMSLLIIMYVSPTITQFIPDFYLYEYFVKNLSILFVILAIGVFIGVLSSLIATSRYMKI